MVRVHIKKNKIAKGHEPNWSSTGYKVVDIKGNQYLIPNIKNIQYF